MRWDLCQRSVQLFEPDIPSASSMSIGSSSKDPCPSGCAGGRWPMGCPSGSANLEEAVATDAAAACPCRRSPSQVLAGSGLYGADGLQGGDSAQWCPGFGICDLHNCALQPYHPGRGPQEAPPLQRKLLPALEELE